MNFYYKCYDVTDLGYFDRQIEYVLINLTNKGSKVHLNLYTSLMAVL